MKYSLIAVGTYGDVAPFAAIGQELIADGHDVTLVANEVFRGLGGLPFESHSTRSDYEAAVANADVWTPGMSALAAFEAFGLPAAEHIREVAASHDTFVMASPLAPTAFAAAKGRCMPVVTWPAWVEMAEALPPLPPGVGLWPKWFAPGWDAIAPSHFPVLEHDYEPDAELVKFLRFEPVAITFGSGANYAGERLEAALQACSATGQPALVLGGKPRHEWPLGVLHRPFVPLRWVLPTCSALIHHGGIGTVAAALETGTPQYILPIAHDHFFNARRVEELGAGFQILDPNTLRTVMNENQTRH